MEKKKYPKAWIENVLTYPESDDRAEIVGTAALDRLAALGALKDPPKPDAHWYCENCAHLSPLDSGRRVLPVTQCSACGLTWKLYREVLDGE